VPKDADANALEQARLELERALASCERRCHELLKT
jgi:hypothetical protein